MRDVIHLFNERKKEVEIYFEHVKNAWSDEAHITFRDDDKMQHQIKLSLDLKQILLANTFLLLYNLVECTLSGALEAIHKDIKRQKFSYDKIKINIQKEIIEYIRKSVASNRFVEGVNDIAIEILNYHPNRREFFSGNIDRELIKDISRKYDFSTRTEARETRNGEAINTVKELRNDLAHGVFSFKECGQARSLLEMEKIKTQSLLYMEQILNNIDNYVKNKEYLKS
jgi:MAE_28990/MAE_18760-like HEPN